MLTAGRGTSGGASNWSSGFLPTTYQGVLFRNKGEPVLNLNNPTGLSDAMQQKTIDALRDLNRERHAGHRRPRNRQPHRRLRAGLPHAVGRPGTDRPQGREQGRRWSCTAWTGEDARSVGRTAAAARGSTTPSPANCLLARRLVERGVRFVNLYHASWDHHSNLDKELAFNCGMADQPVAALLKDLKQRGLLDTTLVVWASEFGRTPLGENRDGWPDVTGRDHHPFAFTLWMAGGGVKGGQVIGKTDEIGWNVVEDPIHVNDFHATILHLFGLDHQQLTYRFQGRDFRLTDVAGKVVKKLLA